MPELTLTLPFPPKNLSPNSRTCWQEKLKSKTAQRDAGFYIAFPHAGKFGKENIPIKLTFYEPDNRHRDWDNSAASAKWLVDGVALGLKVNDKQFRPVTIDFGGVDKKNPRVEIVLEIH